MKKKSKPRIRCWTVHLQNGTSPRGHVCAPSEAAARKSAADWWRLPLGKLRLSPRSVPASLRGPHGGLRGVGAEQPLQMAEFVIGQMPGEPSGAVYKASGRPACRVGLGLKVKDGIIPFKQAKASFLQARAHFLGGERVGGAGATLLVAQGNWRDPVSAKVFEEPTFIGQILWAGPNKFEPTPQVFRSRMKMMCEDVACRLAQKEVLLRLYDGDRATLTRCSPRGKEPPDSPVVP